MWADPIFRESQGLLSDDVVVKILELRSLGHTYPDIAEKLQVTADQVRSIWRGHCYNHIDREYYQFLYNEVKLHKEQIKLLNKKAPQPRLNHEQLRVIVLLKHSGMMYKEIADIFGVTKYVITDFFREHSYKDFDKGAVVLEVDPDFYIN